MYLTNLLSMRSLLTSIALLLSVVTYSQQAPVYGLHFSTSSELRISSLDPSSGNVSYLNSTPTSYGTYISGVSDFNPIDGLYYYVDGSNNLYTISADSGTVVHSTSLANPNNAVSPLTNLAYNWLNDSIYGLEFKTGSLRLVSVDPVTGNQTMISPSVISPDRFSQGNSDIDPVGRRYFYERGNTLFTISLDTGLPIHQVAIQKPDPSAFFINMAYDWSTDVLYGLYFLPNYFGNSPFQPCNSGLFLCSVDVATGQLTLISQSPTSPDCFQGNVCDINPIGREYYYLRSGKVYTVDLDSGTVKFQQTLSSPDPAIAEITNIAYNESFAPVANVINMNMGVDTIWKAPGESVRLDAFVGQRPSYLWQDGHSAAVRDISAPGTYAVSISTGPFQIEGSVVVAETAQSTSLGKSLASLPLQVYPNPTEGKVALSWDASAGEQFSIQIIDLTGRTLFSESIVKQDRIYELDLSTFAAGNYVVTVTGRTMAGRKLIVKD